MAYLEELLPKFRKGAKIRKNYWNKRFYVYFDGGIIRNQDGEVFCFDGFDGEDLTGGFWELYHDPEPDWQYIIDNRCLCYFWDEKFNWAMYGTLGKIEKGSEYRFTMFDDAGNRSSYKNCRPVRRDEVTFYEDKKDD